MRFLIAFLMLPTRAWAGDEFATCHFATECFESEPCTDTGFGFVVNHDDTLGFVIQTDAENIGGLVFDNGFPDETSTLIGATDTAYHMLTIAPDGAARYSVQMQGPVVVSYSGQCEGMK
ncbi:hypothetical protein [Profundibacter amoris]|uniref:Uncharacterized protein n=1 Tax=Profundibacter amoris TaxID=2171755 RepID=A0A347UG76_9RHOB|nr:hypothetical protein [Profundibacter amoris]AXX97854.1 hypothetical protein BAR1_07875 [Profundibacter amoris]